MAIRQIHRIGFVHSASLFASIARIPGVSLYNLQTGAGPEELLPVAGDFRVIDVTDRLADFQETAAVAVNLDLVITCDTAMAQSGRRSWECGCG